MLLFLICSCSSILLRLDWSNKHDGYHLLPCASHWAKYFIYIVCNHHEKMARRDLYSRGNWGSKKLINFLKVIKPSGIAGVWTPELVFFSLSDSDAHISWFKSLPLRMNMDWKGYYFLSHSWGTAVPCFREQWTPNIKQQAGWKSICQQCSTQSKCFSWCPQFSAWGQPGCVREACTHVQGPIRSGLMEPLMFFIWFPL